MAIMTLQKHFRSWRLKHGGIVHYVRGSTMQVFQAPKILKTQKTKNGLQSKLKLVTYNVVAMRNVPSMNFSTLNAVAMTMTPTTNTTTFIVITIINFQSTSPSLTSRKTINF